MTVPHPPNPPNPPIAEHRSRLLQGMARAAADKGYGATTVADIVAAAGVSRRTFYEHFTGKAECLVALYEASSRAVLQVLRDAVDPAEEWPLQVERALGAYFGAMAANPLLLRTLFVEILGLGAQGLAARRRVNQEIAGFMLEVINGSDRPRPAAGVLSSQMAMAVVGGINELVLSSIERQREALLVELVPPAAMLVRAVAGAAREGPP